MRVAAGSVETFDEARFVEGFARQMGVSAADVSVSVEAGSVLVTATVRYDSIAEARTGAERWADLPATDLGAAIGSSVERKGAGQVSEVFFNAPLMSAIALLCADVTIQSSATQHTSIHPKKEPYVFK